MEGTNLLDALRVLATHGLPALRDHSFDLQELGLREKS